MKLRKILWSSSIRRQLIAGVALVHFVLMTAFVVDVVQRQNEFLRHRAEERVLFQAEALSTSSVPHLVFNDVAGLAEIVSGFSRGREVRYVMVTDLRGRVLSHSDSGRAGLYLEDDRTRQVLAGPRERRLISSSGDTVHAVTPVTALGRHLGWAWVGMDLSAERGLIESVKNSGRVYILAAMLAGTFVAVALAAAITRPLRLLLSGAERLARDDFSQPVPVTTENDVGVVTRALNDAMSKLAAHRAELQRARDELELRVEERTRELAAANRELQREIRERREAQEALRRAHDQLEERVRQRTAELGNANKALQREIAERRNAEQALTRANDSLARSNADLKQFAYVASHDLQEPLRTVASYTGLLARRYKDKLDDSANDFIEFTLQGVQRMQALIEDLLAYSRAGATDEPLTILDMDRALDSALINLKSAIESSGARITRDRLPSVPAHHVAMAQLFQNLIGNAIKYRGERTPEIHISARETSGMAVFSVRDNGLGIAPKYAQAVFGIFKRLHGNKYPGTGIGLAICAKIVDRYGGRIWVEPNSGCGSTFSFGLPVPERKIDAAGEA